MAKPGTPASPVSGTTWTARLCRHSVVAAMIATLIADSPRPVGPTISIRRSDGSEFEVAANNVTEQLLEDARPWRTFRWYFNQKHYSGSYWAVTEGCHVIYESRLELARLMRADFDPDVRHVVAQPFLMRARVNGKVRQHVPDFLLFTSAGLTVVDVKPAARLDLPKVAATFGWARQVVEDRGWGFEIATEPDPIQLSNVRFLAGYRKAEGISEIILTALRSRRLHGLTLGDAVRETNAPAPYARAALFHMIWRHELRVDLTQPLSSRTELRKTA